MTPGSVSVQLAGTALDVKVSACVRCRALQQQVSSYLVGAVYDMDGLFLAGSAANNLNSLHSLPGSNINEGGQ